MLLVGLWRVPVDAQQATAVLQQVSQVPDPVAPGQIATITMRLTNNTSADTSFDISITGLPSGWTSTNPGSIVVNQGTAAIFTFDVRVPAGQAGGSFNSIIVTADS